MGVKLEDRHPLSSPSKSRSAWSYSYDLNLQKICDEAFPKTLKSDWSLPEFEANKSMLVLNCDEDQEVDVILQENRHSPENSAIDRLKASGPEFLTWSSLPLPDDPEQSLDNVKLLRFSDTHRQPSWLEKIIRVFPKEMGHYDETKRNNLENIISQIQAIIVDKLQQFIQEMVLPSRQKFEQLQNEYSMEKAMWKNQVTFLKQRVYLLKSELQDVKSANTKAAEQLTNWETWFSQNKSEVKKSFAMSVDSKIMPVESEKSTLCQQKCGIEKDHTDMNLGCYSTNHSELERQVVVKEKKTSEKFLKFRKRKSREGPRSIKRRFTRKPLLKKKIFKKPKNLTVPRLKLRNTDFEKKIEIEDRMHNEALSFYENCKDSNPLVIKSFEEKHPLHKTTNFMINENSSRETCVSFHKCGGKTATLGDDRKYIPTTEKLSGDSLKVSWIKKRSQQFQEKLSLRTEIPQSDSGIFRNFWKRQNSEVPKVSEKESRDLISLDSTEQYVKHLREYLGNSERLSTSPSSITMRSSWL